jgi:hypothetical protein
MLTGIAIVLLFTLIASGQQVAVALGLVATILLLFSLNVPSVTLAHVAFSSLDSYALVAIPERVNDFAPLVVTSLLSRSVSVGS